MRKLGATFALAIGALVLFATPALAHVSIDPSKATEGSFTKLVFRVPNEAQLANMVKFDVTFDVNNPIPLVNVLSKPGWTPTLTTVPLRAPLDSVHGQITKVVSEISWSGGTIAPGQFDEFAVLVGPLPAGIDRLLFPAVQSFSDGTEVRWDQQSFADQAAPEHPMPVLELTSGNTKNEGTKSTGGSNTLALFALVVGAAGVAIGTWTWTIVRRWR
jgi:uncharacterized protein YcnI